ncbi:hypothetical protein GCM10023185_00490 [Hymenobacter saemangeumensis]|uniref:SlyB protein n=1 Tax=Hymenobacter saemangeumensis TaxID=1084522 RepID=A0ABP8HWL4_9BACT
MNTFSRASLLLLLALAGSCQSNNDAATVAADLNSSNPAVVEQARRVQLLEGQIKQQEAVIEAEKTKLEAMQQQLAGVRQTLEGVKKEDRAAQ